MFKFIRALRTLQSDARMVIPNTCTVMYYLNAVRGLRHFTGCDAVIIDPDYCIVVL